MRTVVLKQPGEFVYEDTPPPVSVGPTEVLVRVRRVGICGTDLHAYEGKQPFFSYPRILGHELGVEVVEAGSQVADIEVGMNCAVEPYISCGNCQACLQGKTNCCTTLELIGVHRDGGMRDWITLPGGRLHPSSVLDLDQLALVETLGIGCHAISRAQLQEGEPVVVIGAGPIGLSVIQFAKLAGARIIVVELSQSRREFCSSAFQVEECLDGARDPLAAVQEILNGDLPGVVFDATGNAKSMEASFAYVGNGGRLVFVGFQKGPISFHNPEFHRREMTILATRNAVTDDFIRIVDQMEEGTIDTRPWITHRSNYDGLIEQFPTWLDPEAGVVKAMLEL